MLAFIFYLALSVSTAFGFGFGLPAANRAARFYYFFLKSSYWESFFSSSIVGYLTRISGAARGLAVGIYIILLGSNLPGLFFSFSALSLASFSSLRFYWANSKGFNFLVTGAASAAAYLAFYSSSFFFYYAASNGFNFLGSDDTGLAAAFAASSSFFFC